MKKTKTSFALSAMIILGLASGMGQAQGMPDALQQKVQSLQKASAENERRLHGYQWLETTTITINGNPKSPKQSICRYVPDGGLVKTPVGPPPMPPRLSGGPIRRHIEEKKIAEIEGDMAEVQTLAAMYLPLKPEVIHQALASRRIEFEHNGPNGDSIVINDFAKPGDKLILGIEPPNPKISAVTVESYFASPSDKLTATVQFAMLPDGTTYPSMVTIHAPGKHISITTIQSSFSKPVQ